MTTPLVSVIIPVCNGETTIGSCLRSVLAQRDALLEIHVIDDASKDGSLDEIQAFSLMHSNVRYTVHSRNEGLGRTLNEGIEESRSEFVFIVHQDCELIESNFVRQALDLMKQNPKIGAVTGRRIYELENYSPKEKLFMVANGHISDLNHNGAETQEVTFIEDKCDLYRRQVLDSVGCFPADRFRTSGEDQIVSSNIRRAGCTLVRLGGISYRLAFGSKESTFKGILSKLRVYGRTQAGVLWTVRHSALEGISVSNGQLGRALNRLQMIVAATAMVAGIILSFFSRYFLVLTAAAFLLRLMTYAGGLEKLQGHIELAFVGPIMDVFYSIGFLEGLVFSTVGKKL